MKAKIVLIVAIMAVNPAYAAFDYFTTVASSATIGASCDSSGGGVIYQCNCPMSTSGILAHECSQYGSIPCRLSGVGSGGDTDYRICHYKSLSGKNPCVDVCSCNMTPGSWQTAGNHVVRRMKYSQSPGLYKCTVSGSYEYGCSSGYYVYTGAGASIVCADCPSFGGISGTNAEGTTDITTCYIPANRDGTDSTGTFNFSSACYYTK